MVKYVRATTNKQIEEWERSINDKHNKLAEQYPNPEASGFVGRFKNIPEEVYAPVRTERAELECIRMIHSILTYLDPEDWNLSNDKIVGLVMEDYSNYGNRYYLRESAKTLGWDRVEELVAQEVAEYKNAKINRNVYTDSEGVTYNSVTFYDD